MFKHTALNEHLDGARQDGAQQEAGSSAKLQLMEPSLQLVGGET